MTMLSTISEGQNGGGRAEGSGGHTMIANNDVLTSAWKDLAESYLAMGQCKCTQNKTQKSLNKINITKHDTQN